MLAGAVLSFLRSNFPQITISNYVICQPNPKVKDEAKMQVRNIKKIGNARKALEDLKQSNPSDSELIRLLLGIKIYKPKEEKRLSLSLQIFEILLKYPILRNLDINLAAIFMPTVCAVIDNDYILALEKYLEISERTQIPRAELEMYIQLGINISAAAESSDHYIHFSKARIKFLINEQREKEAGDELDEFLALLPNDKDLLEMKTKLEGSAKVYEGENLYADTAWLFELGGKSERFKKTNDDINFYLQYAKRQQGEILDIGCGTGRVSIELAKAGFKTTAMDLSEQMLAHFRKKLTATPELENNISMVQGSAADYSFDRKFSLIIMPNRVFQLMPSESDAKNCLKCALDHLTEDGIFIINAYNVHEKRENVFNIQTPDKEAYDIVNEENGARVVYKEKIEETDVFAQTQRTTGTYQITWPDGKQETVTDSTLMKYYYEPQLRELVQNAGFEITKHYAWYDKQQYNPPPEIIYVCKKKKIY